MASWRDQMGPASFRGIPFFVESAERSGGRRTVRHEYPFKDEPFVEDMGRKAREFPVEGYVIGDAYLDAKEALIEALEKGGTGELIHPYHGTLRVVVTDFHVRESRNEGGIARFAINFAETPAQPAQPSTLIDAAAKVRATAVLARASVGAEFLSKYSPGILLDSVNDSLRAATLSINNVLETVQMSAQPLATLKKRLTDFEAAVTSLTQEPEELLSSLTDIFDLVDDATSLHEVYSYDPGERPPATTSNREIEQSNFDVTQWLIQRLALIQAALLTLDQTFTSYDEAVTARDALTEKLDDQAENATDDTYPDLQQLRADLVKAVPGDESDLPKLLTVTPAYTIPSLVLAHQLYGNLDLESDLVDRNSVRNPGFVVAGRPLEVLSD